MTDPTPDSDEQLIEHIRNGGDPPEGDDLAQLLAGLREEIDTAAEHDTRK